MSPIRAVISDFGGVLTSPLSESFAAYASTSGISMETLGAAIAAIAERRGTHPIAELECGRITEGAFLDSLSAEASAREGRPVVMHRFGEIYFDHLRPNEPMISYMRSLAARGLRMAICTNNVREWEPLWRPMLPVEEIFETVVDSAFVGVRKPDPEILRITLGRLGVGASEAVLVDDLEVNCAGARELGMSAVWFRSTEQAIAELGELLGG